MDDEKVWSTIRQRVFHGQDKVIFQQVDLTGVAEGRHVDQTDIQYGRCEYCGRGFLPGDRTFEDVFDGTVLCWESAILCWVCRRFVSPHNSTWLLGDACQECFGTWSKRLLVSIGVITAIAGITITFVILT